MAALLLALALLVLGDGAHGEGARSLPLGSTLAHVEIGAGETHLYEFEKTGDVPEGVETIVLRATREQVLRDEAEAVRLCFGVNATPADCAASGESFELWLEYNTLVENTTYVVGFYSSVALRYTMRSCISTCTQLCPNDCNGKFVDQHMFSFLSLFHHPPSNRLMCMRVCAAERAWTASASATRRRCVCGPALTASWTRCSTSAWRRAPLPSLSSLPSSRFAAPPSPTFPPVHTDTRTCNTADTSPGRVGLGVQPGCGRPDHAVVQEAAPAARAEAAAAHTPAPARCRCATVSVHTVAREL